MKLYYSPGACSLAPHIILRTAGLKFEMERVDLDSGTTATGVNFKTINPKGYVPALQLDNGEVLTEGTTIDQYLADLAPQSNLMPQPGKMERYRVQEWLNFITSELHKGFSPLFRSNTPAQTVEQTKESLSSRFAYIEQHLSKNQFLLGNTFTVADAYLFVVASWGKYVKFDLAPWPNVVKYLERIAQRPAVQESMKAEGLIK